MRSATARLQDSVHSNRDRFPRRNAFGVVRHGASADPSGDVQRRGVPMLVKDCDRHGLKFPIGKRAGRKLIDRLDHFRTLTDQAAVIQILSPAGAMISTRARSFVHAIIGHMTTICSGGSHALRAGPDSVTRRSLNRVQFGRSCFMA